MTVPFVPVPKARLTDLWPREWLEERLICRLASAAAAAACRAERVRRQRRAEERALTACARPPALRLVWERFKAGDARSYGTLTGLAITAWRRAEDDPAVMAWLVRHLGEGPGWRAACPGVARIVLERDGRFQVVGFGAPNEPKDGSPAIIVPALVGGATTPIECLDLIAVNPTPPEFVRRATGLVDVLGLAGTDAETALREGAPIGVTGSVAGWLKSWTHEGPRVAGCPAVCVVDPAGPEARELFLSDATFVADDDETAAQLDEWIEAARRAARPPRPEIRVAEPEAAAA